MASSDVFTIGGHDDGEDAVLVLQAGEADTTVARDDVVRTRGLVEIFENPTTARAAGVEVPSELAEEHDGRYVAVAGEVEILREDDETGG